MSENVIHIATPGRYVVQRGFMGDQWNDDESFDSYEEAVESANRSSKLFIAAFRVVERNYSAAEDASETDTFSANGRIS